MNNNGYFVGKNAVVTGAASGIGLALIQELLEQGIAKVVLADINKENLHKQVERLEELYPKKLKGIVCDVSKEQDVKDMLRESVDFMGKLDILINNAGLALGGMFTEIEEASFLKEHFNLSVQTNKDWEKAFAINFYGALYGSREAISLMSNQGGGQVINVISGIAFSPMAYQSMYAATKAALNMLTLTLRYEYWDKGIKFSSATPGTTNTPIWQSVGGAPEKAQTPQQSAKNILKGVALNQRLILGDEEDADGAVHCFNQDAAEGLDEYFLNVARTRRSGKLII